MHIPSRFRVKDPDTITDEINAIGFGTIISHSDNRFDATPVPWVANNADGTLLLSAHLANANPLLAMLRESPDVLVIFTGVNGYISPRGLPTPRSAPTWNYIAIHVHGRCELLDERGTEHVVEKLVSAMEDDRAAPWRSSEMGPRREQLLQHVTGMRVAANKVEAKYKLGQNESDVDLPAILHALQAEGRLDLATRMRDANRQRLTEPAAEQETDPKT